MNSLEIELERVKSHFDGMRYGIRLFAWWKDSIQYVGSGSTTLEKALNEVNSMEHEAIRYVEGKYTKR